MPSLLSFSELGTAQLHLFIYLFIFIYLDSDYTANQTKLGLAEAKSGFGNWFGFCCDIGWSNKNKKNKIKNENKLSWAVPSSEKLSKN